MTKTESSPQMEKVQDVQHDSLPMSDEVVEHVFEGIAQHDDNQDIVSEASNILDEHTAEQYDTRTERIAAKLGRFAAKVSIGASSLRDKLAPSYVSAHAAVGAQSALGTVKHAAQKVGNTYMAPLNKMEDDKSLGRTTRAKRFIGRWAYRGAVAGGIVASVGVAKVYGPEAHAAINRIWVPGTGSAPDHNIVNGDNMTLGYEGGAAPFVGETRYDTSVAGGVDNLVNVLENKSGSSTIDAYSQGADVAREAVSKLSPDEQRQLILNLGGDPSGEKGILTLAHDSPQGKLMGLLGFDTSPLKDTGAATVHEVRVTNDIMADATFTVADAERFNTAVANGDMVSAMRMLATTGEKAGGYFTTHAGAVDVLPQDRVTYNPANPGNATVLTVRTPNGTVTEITPNTTAAEALAARHLGIRMTPEMSQAIEATVDQNVSNEQVVKEWSDAAREGVNNTPWLPPEAKNIINTGVEQVSSAFAPAAQPAPAVETPAWQPAPAATPAYVPAQAAPIIEQAAPVVEQVETFVQQHAPQAAPHVNNFKNFFGLK